MLYLPPVLAIVVVAATAELFGRLRLPGRIALRHELVVFPLVLAVALSMTLLACYRLAPFRPDKVKGTPAATWTSFQTNPNDFEDTLAGDLSHFGVSRVFAGYWLAFPLTFVSGGRVTASGYPLLEESENPCRREAIRPIRHGSSRTRELPGFSDSSASPARRCSIPAARFLALGV